VKAHQRPAARRATYRPARSARAFLRARGRGALPGTQLDFKTLRLAFVGAGAHHLYPFLKRFFPLPQFYLGLAFGWAVPMAYMAASGTLPRVAWVLFVTAVLWRASMNALTRWWTAKNDVKIGVKSSAICSPTWTSSSFAIMQGMMLFR